MPPKERKPRRIYYELSDIKDLLDVSKTTISFWIKHFKLDIQIKGKSNHRKFRENDVVDLLALRYLIRDEMYTLEGAKIKFNLWKRKKYTIPNEYLDIPDDLRFQEYARFLQIEMQKRYVTLDYKGEDNS
jgi:DNA-binding transcriptional MerR regulator